jgi:hypothetical protein
VKGDAVPRAVADVDAFTVNDANLEADTRADIETVVVREGVDVALKTLVTIAESDKVAVPDASVVAVCQADEEPHSVGRSVVDGVTEGSIVLEGCRVAVTEPDA